MQKFHQYILISLLSSVAFLYAGKEGQGDDFMNSGNRNFSQGQYQKALNDFQNAYHKYRADGDQLKGKKAQAKERAGDACIKLGQLNVAIGFYNDAANEHSDGHNWKDAGSVMQKSGDLYVQKSKESLAAGNAADAKRHALSARDSYHKAAQKYSKSNNGKAGAGESLVKAGHVMSGVQIFDKASFDYRNAGEQYAKNDEHSFAAGLAKLAGDAILQFKSTIKEYEDAENHYARAGHWFAKAKDAENSQGCYLLAAQAAMSAGQLWQKSKDYEKARKYYEIAAAHFYDGHNMTYVVIANNAIAAMCSMLHKNSRAAESYGLNGLIYTKAYKKKEDDNFLRYAITMYQKAGGYAAADGSYKKSAEYYTVVGDLYALLFNNNALAFYQLAQQQYKTSKSSVPNSLKKKIAAVA